jgi:hypothetical protein
MNGDSKTDLVHRHNGGVNIWLATANGNYSLSLNPQGQYTYTDGEWYLADMNGDQMTDLVHRWSSGINVWKSAGSGYFNLVQNPMSQYGFSEGQWL